MKKQRKRFLELEVLEDRITPSTFTRLADVDGYATDPGLDGVFDSVNTSGTSLQTRYYQGVAGQAEDRSILEFNISGLSPTAQITSARFYGYARSLGYEGTNGLTVTFYGYTGNGAVTTADALATSTQIGQLTNYTQAGLFYVDLNTQFVQSMLGSTYLGIVMKVEGSALFYSDSREYSGSSSPPTLNIQYDAPPNQAPTANNDSYSTNEDSPLFITGTGVLANDTDPEGNSLTPSVVSYPSHGTLTFYSTGSFYYTPAANYNGPDSFTYRVYDGSSYSNTATVSLTVNPVNDAPKANNDSYSVMWNSTLTVAAPGVLGNDTDAENSPLTAALFTGPVHGTVTVGSDGSFVYTPTAGYYGSDSFTYRANDGALNSMAGTVTITVTTPHQPPVAGNESYTQSEDNVLTVAAAGVLSNDSDPEGQPVSAVLYTGPLHGSLSLNSNGSFVYTPNANYFGSDSFRYRASDGELLSNIATVSLTINPVNDAPVAVDDSFTLNEDQTLTVGVTAGITTITMQSQAGDYIGQGRTYSFTPQTGTITANRNYDNGVSLYYSSGSTTWNFDFAAAYNATLTPGTYGNATRWPFQADSVPGLNVSGEGRGSNTLTGNFTVSQASYLANGTVDRFSASFEQHSGGAVPALTGQINYFRTQGYSGVLQNDQDADGDPLTAMLVSGPSHGTLTLNSDGTFSYTPDANFSGVDSFSYKTSDGTAQSNVATVTFTVNPVNDAPVAAADAFAVDENSVLVVGAPGILGNDSDMDSSALTASLQAAPQHGSIALGADGSFTYTPDANFHGTDSFSYRASDGSLESATTTVNLIVNAVNSAPSATGDSFATNEDTALVVAAPGVLANDSDVDGNTLSAVLVSGPEHGSLTLNADGSFTYTPDANYNGGDSFAYKANDGTLDSAAVTVALTITAVNDAPVAASDAFSLTEDGTLTVAGAGVLGNDSDVEGDALSAVLVGGPAHGTLSFAADGTFTYTPDANFNGVDSFTYKANDGSDDSSVVTVSLTIAAVNDAPVAAADAFTLAEDGTLTVAAPGVLSNDVDVDGNPLTAILVGGPAHGVVTLNADGSFTFTPDANYNGSDSFTYKAKDGSLDSNLATVSLTITAVNDAPVAANDAFSLAEDGTLTVAGSGVLGNDSDVDGNPLSAVLVSGPAHGTLNFAADGSFTYAPNANYNGSDSFTYKANDGTTDSNVATVSISISAVNDAPVANAGPDALNGEGGTFTFDGRSSFDIDSGPLTYSWDFGDGSTATGAVVNHAHADQGTYLVKLTVSDGLTSSTDTLVLTVINGAPLALINGPTNGVRGQERTFTFGADDPSPVDELYPFTYAINWGDGTTQTVSGPTSLQQDHVFTASGTFNVRVTATDKDGGVSSLAQRTITIAAVQLQGSNLVVGGTTGNDTILLKVADQSGGVKVTIGGAVQGTYNFSGQILVYAQAGTDNVTFETTKFGSTTYYIQDAAVVFGGDGNDTLDARGSSANNVIVGGAGTDTIYGGTGRDLMIGGAGIDTLRGGAGDDVLIGNTTTYDANLTALLALMAEWGRTDADYTTRVNHLLGNSGGNNGTTFFNPSTVLTDAAIDQLYGEAGQDFFLTTGSGASKDKVNDLAGGELNIGM